jgi:lycopene beta-cyclase
VHRFIADIIVVGAGPAGLCIAADLAKRGCSVGIVTRDDQLSWPNTYGTWADEIAGTLLEDCVADRWANTEIALETGNVKSLGRSYVRMDNANCLQTLSSLLQEHGTPMESGGVVSLEHDDFGTTLRLTSGETVRGKLVIDATGTGQFTLKSGPAPSLFQYAVGWRVDGEHPYAVDTMRLMDFSSDGVHGSSEAPSFLYAMPLDGGVFVEETTLITNAEPDMDELTRRLEARLARDGVTGSRRGQVETVRVPMNTPMPDLSQRVVAFGAAAAMIHPATGYSFGRTAKTSGPLADVLVAALADGGSPETIAELAYAMLWSEDTVLADELLRFGARFLTTLNTRQTRRFFRAFFSTSRESWVAYLRGDLPAGELATVMLAVFKASPANMRLRMMWTGAELKTAVSAFRSLNRTRRSA